MAPEEARNPIYKCINGTTMKSLFITFLVLFGFRLLVGLTSQFVIHPLMLKLNILKEDIRLRITIQNKAEARLVHAKVFPLHMQARERPRRKRSSEGERGVLTRQLLSVYTVRATCLHVPRQKCDMCADGLGRC